MPKYKVISIIENNKKMLNVEYLSTNKLYHEKERLSDCGIVFIQVPYLMKQNKGLLYMYVSNRCRSVTSQNKSLSGLLEDNIDTISILIPKQEK